MLEALGLHKVELNCLFILNSSAWQVDEPFTLLDFLSIVER